VWQGKELGSGGSENVNHGTLGIEAKVSARGNGKVFVERVAEQRSCLSLLYEYGNYNGAEGQK